MLYTLGLVGVCLAWLLPGHYYPYTAFQQDMLSAGGCTLVALAAVVTVREWPARLPVPAAVSLLLALVPLTQWAAGILPFLSDAALSASYLAGFALAVIAGAQLAATQKRFVGVLFAAIALAAVVSVGVGLTQWLGLGPYMFVEPATPGDRMFANLAQPNQLASLLAIGLAAMLWFFESRRIGGIAAAATIVLLVAGLALTQSRAGVLFVACFVALWALYRRRLALRTSGTAVAAMAALFAVAAFARAPVLAFLRVADNPGVVDVRVVSGFRWGHWQTLWDALMQQPWLGYGWLQISKAQQAAVLEHPPTFELLSAAHNQLLDFLIWNGLPIGLALIGAIAWWAIHRARMCADIDTWASLTALAVLGVHSMVEFPLQYAYFLLPAGLLVGVIEARAPESPALRLSLRIGRTLFAAALFAMAGLLYVLWDEYYAIEEAVRQVRLKLETHIVHPDLNPRPPDVVVLDGQREYIRFLLSEPRAGMTASELDWMHTVATRFPSPGALTHYAVAAGLNGRIDAARRSLELMCRMSVRRHCDAGRTAWAARAEAMPALRAVSYPATPSQP